ncbi:MAG: OmpA family protein [Treponema sp.]|jgi:outer membrane protein OmpA-like peptidoglycan-associated protein|nr:OmpA family protein [Treponema sp.]
MRKIILLFSILSIVFLLVTAFTSCKTPPPVEEPPPPVEEPPPPPPPPAPDTAGPELDVKFSTRFFSPDNDGVEDELIVSINCRDESPIKEWKIEIREPQPPYLLFSEWSGEGDPPAQIVWNGRSSKGELVQSASDYPFTLVVSDVPGNSSTFEGEIEVDVLVIREGDLLRVQVPSIVFGPNSGGFDSLSGEITANNDYILTRIAQVLNKFDTYKVKVEGHANFTAATEAARKQEQDRELQPLSEKRARFVADYLTKLGVDRGRLSAFGIGGARPVVKYEDHDNWWKNRRVEFILVK